MKGDYFVNKECIGCELCLEHAPKNFGMKGERAYVKVQPKSTAAKGNCMNAKLNCPVEAIKKKLK